MDYDGLVAGIGRAQALAIAGDPDGARAVYAELWEEATTGADSYAACVVAHFMAHAQAEPAAQLLWHGRALEAAEAADDERVLPFFPSLYANLADVHLRLGAPEQARQHIEKAREVQHRLGEEGYGRMIRSLIDRLDESTAS